MFLQAGYLSLTPSQRQRTEGKFYTDDSYLTFYIRCYYDSLCCVYIYVFALYYYLKRVYTAM